MVVVGGGHAGCEAALAAARLGCKTLMLTLNLDRIAWQVGRDARLLVLGTCCPHWQARGRPPQQPCGWQQWLKSCRSQHVYPITAWSC